MSGGGGHEGGEASSGMGVLWIIVATFVLMWGVWYFAHTQLIEGYFFVKRLEIDVIEFFTGQLGDLGTYIRHTPASRIDFNSLSLVADRVGNYLVAPVVMILVALGSILYFRSSATLYSETYTMAKLMQKESVNWPQNIPVLDQNLVKQNISEGKWSMALSPMMFAKQFDLLTVPVKQKGEDQLESESRLVVSVKKDKADRVFAMQLGYLWRGVDQLKPYVRALFAAFAARGAQDAEASDALLRQLSRNHHNLSGVNELIEKYGHSQEIEKIIKTHAYEYTVMASMLLYARTDGVLSSSEFLWLKPVDRRLWFVLNTVGRRVAVPEVAGIYGHWIVETKLERALRVPVVEHATSALILAVSEQRYR